ncbi:copper transport protein ATX1 [Benincasa hispida]|uniref:copper transport protein ATX1 n=1 Tax=Benincasa hispida TaxID=102211 RepID=UPI0019024158|nr:copper transport protein ATX1 [Benincasa hispida]
MEQSLLFSENLTPPSFQVIVINANMSCKGCRQRVSQIVCKMSELVEFTIDVTKRQVIVKGNVKCQSKNEENTMKKCNSLKSPSPQFSNKCF